MPVTDSPYEAALGADVAMLHPKLRAYFSAIPPGMVGHGAGVFDVVGTPRRWLWPVLGLLARDGILFPAWQRSVPFRVANHPTGNTGVTAARTFEFAGGSRTMVDEIVFEHGALLDRLGASGRLVATFRSTIVDGALHLDSTRVGFAIGSRTLWVPTLVAPRVTLVERFDDATGRQHVSVRLDHPIIGTLYEYAGAFTYELRPGEHSE